MYIHDSVSVYAYIQTCKSVVGGLQRGSLRHGAQGQLGLRHAALRPGKLAPELGHANHYRCGCALNVRRDERNLEQVPQSCSCEAAARDSWWTMGELAINWNSSGCIATHIGGWFSRDAVAAMLRGSLALEEHHRDARVPVSCFHRR